MVEVLCVALTGAAFSFENDSYFEPGNAPRIGHAILAIDPDALAGAASYFSRLEVMVGGPCSRARGVCASPGARRHQSVGQDARGGIEIRKRCTQSCCNWLRSGTAWTR